MQKRLLLENCEKLKKNRKLLCIYQIFFVPLRVDWCSVPICMHYPFANCTLKQLIPGGHDRNKNNEGFVSPYNRGKK